MIVDILLFIGGSVLGIVIGTLLMVWFTLHMEEREDDDEWL